MRVQKIMLGLVSSLLFGAMALGSMGFLLQAQAAATLAQKTVFRTIDVVNPTPQNNPKGAGFPGYRGSGQLVLFNASSGLSNTQTNEYGFEVTVVNGVVVAQEGANSAIPMTQTEGEDTFVLSGHGSARAWLVAQVPLGASVHFNAANLTLQVDINAQTYLRQCQLAYQKGQAQFTPNIRAWYVQNYTRCQVLEGQVETQAETMACAQSLLLGLQKKLWGTYARHAETAQLRGVWHRPVETTVADVAKTLDRFKAAGLNQVFLETFFHGYTLFKSQTMQAYGMPAVHPKFAALDDPLHVWITEAKKRNMGIHTWVETYYAGHKTIDAGGPIVKLHPDWLNVPFYGLKKETLDSPTVPVASRLESGAYFLDPSNSTVSQFLLSMLAEVATRYDVAGINMDYIRYPSSMPTDKLVNVASSWGYTTEARQKFLAQYGADPAWVVSQPDTTEELSTLQLRWRQYKEAQVVQLVQAVAAQVKSLRPALKLSACVFANPLEAKLRKHQDWRQFPVDFFTPLTMTSAPKVIAEDVRRVKLETSKPVYAGLFGPFNDNTPEDVLHQIETAQLSLANGFVLFDSAHLKQMTEQALATAFASTTSSGSALLPAPQPVATPVPVKRRHWWQRS